MSADDGLEEIVRQWQQMWNAGDMHSTARLFCEDADFVNVRGRRDRAGARQAS